MSNPTQKIPERVVRLSELDEDEYFAWMAIFGGKPDADPRVAEGARSLMLGETEASLHARVQAGTRKLMERGAIVATGPEVDGYVPLRSVVQWAQDVHFLSETRRGGLR